jgi:uncharacterized protein GlcG (DUF336 family)
MTLLSKKRWVALGLLAVAGTAAPIGLSSCSANGTSAPTIFVTGGPAIPLTAVEVNTILARAINSIEAIAPATIEIHAAVTDRTGDILGVYSTVGATETDADNIAVSLARTTSFFSNSQAPLSSRTVETLGRFHFPPTFADELIASQLPTSGAGNTVIAPTRRCSGVAGTPQGPLWQINSTNRGANVATGLTTPPTLFNTNNAQPGPPGEPLPDPNAANIFFQPSRNIGGTFPSPGITLLPGAVPLFKANASGVARLVGGVGVYVVRTSGPQAGEPDVAAGEYAAIQGASGSGAVGDEDFFFDAIPLEGAITIVGVLLPYVKQTTIPAGYQARVGAAPGAFVQAPVPGREDPFGYLIGPRPAQTGNGGEVLTQNDVETIIAQCVASANITRGQVRLPLGSSSKIIATIVDARGLILAHYRMEDTLTDAIDVVPAKARSTVYYCRPGGPFSTNVTNSGFDFPFGDAWQGFPTDPTGQNRGIALTTRTLGFLSQPFYPPGIGGTFSQAEYIAALPNFTPAQGNTAPGPLYNLALLNQLPGQVDRWGNETADPGYQNGLTFFPGSVPLYKNGQLVGALGVSGDGVEQNDLIAFEGGAGFEPPPELRIDNFEFDGVKLPYLKFPETPR